jgi:hypothetical protein
VNRHCCARVRIGALAGVLAALLAACAPAPARPPEHPLGAGCTWPVDLDPARGGHAVLGTAGELVLLDVATGGVVARCDGVRSVVPRPTFTAPGYLSDPLSAGSAVLSPVSPDLRHVVVPGGVAELASGRVVPDPDPEWTAAALPGGGTVLRMRVRPDQPAPTLAQDWCVAPSPTAARAECRPLAGAGDGVPVVHEDGTVGWAGGAAMPADFGGLPGVVQTDGRGVVQARLDDSTRADGTTTLVDPTLGAGVFDPNEVRFAHGVAEDMIERPTWFTLTAVSGNAATAVLHSAPVSWADVRWDPVAHNREAGPYGAAVVDGGRAVVLAMRGRTAGVEVADSRLAVRFVVVREDGAGLEVARLPVGPDGPLRDLPRILRWPDSGNEGATSR